MSKRSARLAVSTARAAVQELCTGDGSSTKMSKRNQEDPTKIKAKLATPKAGGSKAKVPKLDKPSKIVPITETDNGIAGTSSSLAIKNKTPVIANKKTPVKNTMRLGRDFFHQETIPLCEALFIEHNFILNSG